MRPGEENDGAGEARSRPAGDDAAEIERRAPVFVLIHSPLLGPDSWSSVAEQLRATGYEAVVPSLRGMATAAAPKWQYATSAVRAATVGIDSPLVLTGHGEAGHLLPAVADQLPHAPSGLLFVDASLPAASGSASLAAREHFCDWVPMPIGWSRQRCAYLCLSDEDCHESAMRARKYGWPVAAIRGAQHTSIVSDAEAVATVLLELASELLSPASQYNEQAGATRDRVTAGAVARSERPHDALEGAQMLTAPSCA